MLRCKSQGKHSGQFEVRANDLGTSLHIKIFLSVTYRPRLKKKKSFIFRTDKLRFDSNTVIKEERQSLH